MVSIVFSSEEKARCFDEICSHFYMANFGSMSKSDMDLMMFRFYLQKMTDESKDENSGMIDYAKCSDFKMAKSLGITPARVRSLKTRVQLATPMKYDWKEQFARLIDNADYDPKSMMVSLNVPDPRLFLEIQDLVEDKGGYVEKQFNGSLLRVKAPYFLEVLAETDAGKTRDELLKAIQMSFASSRLEDVKYDPMRLGKAIMSGAADFTDVLSHLKEMLPSTATLTTAFIGKIASFFVKKKHSVGNG